MVLQTFWDATHLWQKLSARLPHTFWKKNKDDTKQLRRDISLELKIHINSGQKPEFEHQMYNHLPNEEEHKDHIDEQTPKC